MSGLKPAVFPQKKGQAVKASDQGKSAGKVGKNSPVAAKFAQIWGQINNALNAKGPLKPTIQEPIVQQRPDTPVAFTPPQEPIISALPIQADPPVQDHRRASVPHPTVHIEKQNLGRSEQRLNLAPATSPQTRTNQSEQKSVPEVASPPQNTDTPRPTSPVAKNASKETNTHTPTEPRKHDLPGPSIENPTILENIDTEKKSLPISVPHGGRGSPKLQSQPELPTRTRVRPPESNDTLPNNTVTFPHSENTASEAPVKKSADTGIDDTHPQPTEPITWVAPWPLQSVLPVIPQNPQPELQTRPSPNNRNVSTHLAPERPAEPAKTQSQTPSLKPASTRLDLANSPIPTRPTQPIDRPVTESIVPSPKIFSPASVDRIVLPSRSIPVENRQQKFPPQPNSHLDSVALPRKQAAMEPILSLSEKHIEYTKPSPPKLENAKTNAPSQRSEPLPASPPSYSRPVSPLYAQGSREQPATPESIQAPSVNANELPISRKPVRTPEKRLPIIPSTTSAPAPISASPAPISASPAPISASPAPISASPAPISTLPPRPTVIHVPSAVIAPNQAHADQSIQDKKPLPVVSTGGKKQAQNTQSEPSSNEKANQTSLSLQSTSTTTKPLPVSEPQPAISFPEPISKILSHSQQTEHASQSPTDRPIAQPPLDFTPVHIEIPSKEPVQFQNTPIDPMVSNRSVATDPNQIRLEQAEPNPVQTLESAPNQMSAHFMNDQPISMDSPALAARPMPVIHENTPFVSIADKSPQTSKSFEIATPQDHRIQAEPTANLETLSPSLPIPPTPLPQSERPPTHQMASVADTSTPLSAPITDFLHDVIHDPGVKISIQPNVAHMAITSTEGDLSLHVRVRDGNTSINMTGSMAPLFESRGPEMRQILASEGLQLGNFVTTDGGQGKGSHHPPSPEPPIKQPLPHPQPVTHVTTAMERNSHESGHIHITA